MLIGVLAVLVVSLLLNVGVVAAGVVVFRRLSAMAREFVTPPAEGELSPLAQVTAALGQDFARSIVLQLKQQIAAPASHMARQENLIREDMAQAELAEAGGGWGALLGLLPRNVQKRVLGNPAAAAALIGLLGKGGGGAASGGANGGRSSVQERLKKLA